ncbi:diguanylate cyclase [Salinibacterium sp. SYSU T00001]|uniref:diguanylate cyclase domain-containing protein n=1 Tax=Homoserinimonas sedimenticola TaxID=2986805 RepID=UPI0022362574|nr:diguanylate cyclase [Salinibacterium sedimenticola]MCW4386483.1 diguanylate cyclase [Salinibacterium sedimenticola]
MTADWESLFRSAPCGLLAATETGRITAANDTYAQWSGREQGGVGDYLVDHLTPGTRLFFESRLMPTLREQGEVREAALELRRPDGSVLPIFVNIAVRGAGSALSVAVFDASSRQGFERALLVARRNAEDSAERLGVLQRASFDFASSSSRDELSSAAITAARRATDASWVSVLALDESFQLWAGEHPLDTDTLHLPGSPEAEAIETAAPVICRTPAEISERFPRAAEALADANVESLCVIPGLYEGRAGGVLFCGFSRPRTIDDAMVDTLSAIVVQALLVYQGVVLREELMRLALHDSLTGLPNRAQSLERLEQMMAAADRHERDVAVLFLDLDGFKAINDSLGHAAGDDVLRQTAERLRGAVRNGDVVARLGGDEFIVLCDDIGESDVHGLAARIQRSVREPLAGIPPELSVSASIGISMRHPSLGAVPAERMLDEADAAMYESKRSGKARTTLVVVDAT